MCSLFSPTPKLKITFDPTYWFLKVSKVLWNVGYGILVVYLLENYILSRVFEWK